MISEYVKEQKRYTQKELCGILHCTNEKAVSLIRKLKEFGVLKVVKASDAQRNLSDLQEEDVEITDVEPNEGDYLYVFTFVGIIVVAGRVLKCYPKYLQNSEEPIKELRQILKVLEKYNSKEQILHIFNDSNESQSFNLLAVLLSLIYDYFENGIYSNTEDIIESNGSGEIIWDKTINETFTLISSNRPFYPDLQTKRRITNDYDYFQRLHECVLTKASKELKNASLLELFDISEIDLTDEMLDDFGDNEYILYRIEKELNTQFNTRKQLVLKTIYALVSNDGSLYDVDGLSLYGTNSFNLVWERVCAEILDNKLDERLETLKLPVPLKQDYDKKERLIDLIEKPLWTITGLKAKDTLIPDFVTIKGNKFIIFDAKYYNALLEPGKVPKNQPGIESITKQFLYQLAYYQFVTDHSFESVSNCFILPTEKDEVIEKGEVSMQILSDLGLKNIKIRLLPAQAAYDYYLSGNKIEVEYLKL